MPVVVYGTYGPPMLAFPTSGGDEWEQERMHMVGALAEFLDAGRLKLFTVASLNVETFLDRHSHPGHRSYLQSQYDEYIRQEVVPFIRDNCRTPELTVATMGASLGAFHAANSLLKHPDVFKRCFALSGVFDIRRFMDGHYDDNVYFNNPVDYLANLSDPWYLDALRSCDIYLITGTGPWENSGPSYALAQMLASKGIPHHLDDWGAAGGHDWPFWHAQMREYVGRIY